MNNHSCGPVCLEEMLEAREQRVKRQQALLKTWGVPLVSFTLNLAGPYKRSLSADRAFDEGCRLILDQLRRHGLAPLAREEDRAKTGCELRLAVAGDAVRIKELMSRIEESSDLGRLLDIDVLDTSGRKLSRETMGGRGRRCLVCGGDAFACARNRSHSVEELRRRTREIILGHFDGRLWDHIAALAVRGLLYEVSVTPKPGLVDRANSGAHQDMDIFTFMDSASVLLPYFRQCAALGGALQDEDPAGLFARLRYPGQLAEEAMLQATGGVNTHKGAIFSLGILCAAMGRLAVLGTPWTPESLGAAASAMATPALRDFEGVAAATAATFGEKLYCAAGITGIRGEAAAGFPSVRRYGLPVLQERLRRGDGPNAAGTAALTHLMAHVEDTNVIARSSLERQRQLRSSMAARLEQGELSSGELAEMDRAYIRENISPGGCADLLAVTFLFHFAQTSSLNTGKLLEELFPREGLEGVNRALGRPYTLEGTIIHGRARGRTVGMPTANLDPAAGSVLPPHGVYATLFRFDGREQAGLTNVGPRPSVGGDQVTVETYLPDFEGDLYGRRVLLEFRGFVREVRKMSGLEEVHRQVERDLDAARMILEETAL